MRKPLLATVTALALLAVAFPGSTVAKGNEGGVCKKGGWRELIQRSEGGHEGYAFRNQGACVGHLARSGSLVLPTPFAITCALTFGATYRAQNSGFQPACVWFGISFEDFLAAAEQLCSDDESVVGPWFPPDGKPAIAGCEPL